MIDNEQICGSCGTPSESLKHSARGNVDLCEMCVPWVKRSLNRTRSIPRWIRPHASLEYVAELRGKFQEMFHRDHRNQMIRHHIMDMGFPYLGPFNDASWSNSFSILNFEDVQTPAPNISETVVDNELSRLEKAGVIRLPTQPMLRKYVAHLLRGDFGLANKRRFITALFIWLVSDDEFIARVPEAWATSFNFLRDVVKELEDRASFVDSGIHVIGSSGNTYRIQSRAQKPYYLVTRIVEDKRIPICIDPLGASNVVFGDVLVTLVLSLYDDQISARRINTLSQHVFGTPVHHQRQRNVNIDHLWRRALGNAPEDAPEDTGDDNPGMPMAWQRLLDRFQTNLDDWTHMEDDHGEH